MLRYLIPSSWPYEAMLRLPSSEHDEVKLWCHNNFGSQYDEEPRWQQIPGGARYDGIQVILVNWYCFARTEDATLFGLTWC
jgi:hypothetical protein